MAIVYDKDTVPASGLERELARERQARERHDEQRAHLAPLEDLRSKDARERTDFVAPMKRHNRRQAP